MKKTWSLLFSFSLFLFSYAQDLHKMHEMGKNYLIDGDYPNAEMLLYNVYKSDTANMAVIKDLAICYLFEKEYEKAIALISPLIKKDSADDQCYQILGNLYQAKKDYPSGLEILAKAIEKYPNNGAFYNQIGELLQIGNNAQCITYWEKGIEKDPSYPGNYFNACKYLDATNSRAWAVVYGEIYVNLDPLNIRTSEIKEIILNDYILMLRTLSSAVISRENNKLISKIYEQLFRQSDLIKKGITTASLTMIRTRFILDWYYDKSETLPFALFDYHRKLLRNGMFDAYNQWLFGSSENLEAFQRWTQLHNQEYESFIRYQRSETFKVPGAQYYH
jgi:tetratricopeptide (TPR) repeat protein